MAGSRTQERILNYIRNHLRKQGYAPSIRDIMRHCGFKSPRAVSFHLEKLEKNGSIRRAGKARSIVPAGHDDMEVLPIFGAIPAGFPEPQGESLIGEVAVRPSWFSRETNSAGYGLKVRGDSMKDAGICDGDIAVVIQRRPKPGDVVVAMIDGENTLKRLVKKEGAYFLKAENSAYPELTPSEELKVQGVVVGLYRKIS